MGNITSKPTKSSKNVSSSIPGANVNHQVGATPGVGTRPRAGRPK